MQVKLWTWKIYKTKDFKECRRKYHYVILGHKCFLLKWKKKKSMTLFNKVTSKPIAPSLCYILIYLSNSCKFFRLSLVNLGRTRVVLTCNGFIWMRERRKQNGPTEHSCLCLCFRECYLHIYLPSFSWYKFKTESWDF